MPAPTYTEITHDGQLGESPRGEWYLDAKNITRFRAKRLLKCAWTDCPALINYLMTEAGGSYPHPDGTPFACARNIKPHGRGLTSSGGAHMLAYAEAILEVSYDSAGPQWIGGTYVDEQMVPEQFWIHPPAGTFYWANGDALTKDEMKTSYPLLGWNYHLTLGRLLSLPSTPLSYIGTCNATAKQTYYLGLGFGAQTVLYGSPHIESHSAMGEGTRYSVAYQHPVNPFSWNCWWNSKNGAWEPLYYDNGAASRYYQYPSGW